MYSLKGLFILANAVKKQKWSVFTETIQSGTITAFESNIRGLQATYLNKDSNTCKESYEIWKYIFVMKICYESTCAV